MTTARGSARSCCARRCARPSVLAKALATLDRVSGGRLDVGLGAGWYEPEYEAIGMTMPSPGRAASPGSARRSIVLREACSAAARARSTGASTAPTAR